MGQPAAQRLKSDGSATEVYVTYNHGKTGADVTPAPLGIAGRSTPNRGCMSQWGAQWLARNGWEWPAILRYFYGADLQLAGPAAPSIRPAPSPAGSAPKGDGAVATLALALAAAGVSYVGQGALKEGVI
jgi:hypothetical protein